MQPGHFPMHFCHWQQRISLGEQRAAAAAAAAASLPGPSPLLIQVVTEPTDFHCIAIHLPML